MLPNLEMFIPQAHPDAKQRWKTLRHKPLTCRKTHRRPTAAVFMPAAIHHKKVSHTGLTSLLSFKVKTAMTRMSSAHHGTSTQLTSGTCQHSGTLPCSPRAAHERLLREPPHKVILDAPSGRCIKLPPNVIRRMTSPPWGP